MRKLLFAALAAVGLAGLTSAATAAALNGIALTNGADINGPSLASGADTAGLSLEGVIVPDAAE
jgi:hypothetical protein